jgi:hypothetical protein
MGLSPSFYAQRSEGLAAKSSIGRGCIMDTSNSNGENNRRSLPPEGRCGACGRPLRLIFSKRFGRLFVNPRCECGTILEISDDDLGNRVVQLLKAYYGITNDGTGVELIEEGQKV